jgi:excisionase family DNA binding protein
MRWFKASEAAEYAGCHPETIREALRGGGLQGVQRSKGSVWHIRADWLEAWVLGGLTAEAKVAA